MLPWLTQSLCVPAETKEAEKKLIISTHMDYTQIRIMNVLADEDHHAAAVVCMKGVKLR